MRTTMRLALAAMAVLMLAVPTAHAATLEPVVVFTDIAGDNVTGDAGNPIGAAVDLDAGLIAETDTTLELSWKVVDLVDALPPQVPQLTIYFFEFVLTNPDTGKSAPFQVRARLYPAEPVPVNPNDPTGPMNPPDNVPPYWPYGQVQGNCTTGTTVITCKPIGFANVTVDPIANTITASVARSLLKTNAGEDLAVDGAELSDTVIFNGISACIPAVVVTNASTCDDATMDEPYVLGSAR